MIEYFYVTAITFFSFSNEAVAFWRLMNKFLEEVWVLVCSLFDWGRVRMVSTVVAPLMTFSMFSFSVVISSFSEHEFS